MWIRKQAARIVGLTLAAACAAVLQAPTAAAAPPIPAFAGANDMACHPSPERPQPVLLVHGSGTDAPNSFALLAPLLRAEGYCVFAADLGPTPGLREVVSGQAGSGTMGIGPVGAAMLGRTIYGVGDIDRMATELNDVVQTVQRATGARQIALVGHSTGGNVIRQYLRAQGAAAVTQVITLGTPYRGSTWGGLRTNYPDLASLGLDNEEIAAQVFGTPGQQQVVGSPLLNRLNAGGETVPGLRYTALASRADEIITPQETALLAAPTGDNRNIWLQDGCPTDIANHSGLLGDTRAAAIVLSTLANDNRALPC